MTENDIELLFTYHNPVGLDPNRFTEIREAAKLLGLSILKNGGKESEIEKSIDQLRKCVFYAVASIVVPNLQKEENG